MDPQPDEFSPDTFYGLMPSTPSPPSDIEHLIWALQNLHHGADDSDGSGASPWEPAGQADPSAYQISPTTPIADSDAANSSPFEPRRTRADWPPSILLDPTTSSEPRYYTARPGDSISTILGTSAPDAVGEFMRLNGLSTSQIGTGGTYQLPDLDAPRLDGATSLGLAAMKADRARLADQAARAASPGGWPGAACGPTPADVSVAGMIGLHPRSAPTGPNWADLTSESNQLAQEKANLQGARNQDVSIDGVQYRPFHTSTADGLARVPQLYDTGLRQARGQVLDTMEEIPSASWEGAAWLALPDDPGINARLALSTALGGVVLSQGAAAGTAGDPIWRTTATPEFEPAPTSGLVGRSPETSLQETGYGTHTQFVDAAETKYQEFQDHHYAQIAQLVAQGEIPNIPMIIGQRLDGAVRPQMRGWLGRQDIREGPGEIVQLNRRLYDQRRLSDQQNRGDDQQKPGGDQQGSGPFRIPDFYIPGAGIILDGSMAAKTNRFPQIRDFRDFSGGADTVIIRPSGLEAAPFDGGPAQVVGSYGIVPRAPASGRAR